MDACTLSWTRSLHVLLFAVLIQPFIHWSTYLCMAWHFHCLGIPGSQQLNAERPIYHQRWRDVVGGCMEVGPQGTCCFGMKQWSGYPTTGTKIVPTNTEIYYPRNNGEKLINDDCSILQHIIMFYTTTRVWRGRGSGSDKWVPSSRNKGGNNDQDGSKPATVNRNIKIVPPCKTRSSHSTGSSGSYFIFREDIIYGQLETAGKVEWNIQWMWPRHG